MSSGATRESLVPSSNLLENGIYVVVRVTASAAARVTSHRGRSATGHWWRPAFRHSTGAEACEDRLERSQQD
jgi:hypothetical protein